MIRKIKVLTPNRTMSCFTKIRKWESKSMRIILSLMESDLISPMLKSQSMLKIMRSSSTTVLIALVELATTFYLGRPTTIVLSSSLP
jgi:hypothetical protein